MNLNVGRYLLLFEVFFQSYESDTNSNGKLISVIISFIYSFDFIKIWNRKMVPLATHKLLWTWCCVHPVDEDASRWKKFACITFTFLLSIANLSVVPASVEFVIENVSDNPEAALHALFQITAYIGMIYANINGLFLRHKITAIFTKLTQIYEKSKTKFPQFHIYFVSLFPSFI